MSGEEARFGTGRLADQLVHAPDTDRIISVEGKGGRIGGDIGSAEIDRGGAQPAARVAKQREKALHHTAGKTEAQFIHEAAGGVVRAEGKDTVFVKDDAETAIGNPMVLIRKGAKLVLENRLAAVACNHTHPSFINSSFSTLY